MKQNIGKLVYSLSAVLLFTYTIGVGINSIFRYNNFKKEFDLKLNKLSDLKGKRKEFKMKLSNLNKLSSWEALSRVKLNMVKRDELIYKFYYKEGV